VDVQPSKPMASLEGYRHLERETDDGDTFDDEKFSGPMLGVEFRF